MPVADIPSRIQMTPEVVVAVDCMAEALVRLLKDSLVGAEFLGNPVVVLGTECIAAQMNLLAEQLAESRSYKVALTGEMHHADMLSLIMSDVMDRALTRHRRGVN
jgi:geranylgeranyl pyrophosphate synthase